MKLVLGCLIVVALLLGISFCFVHQEQDCLAAPLTAVSGAITENTTWTLADSPYIVTGDIIVEPDATLTIEPGAEVRFDGVYALSVRGTLLAEGLPGQEVLFTSNQTDPEPGDWGVLDFRADSNPSHLLHTIVEYGGNGSKAGWYCWAGMVCANTSSLVVEESTLRHSATRGVVLAQSSASLVNNTFQQMVFEAIRLHICDLAVGECHPTIVGNSFASTQAPILHAAPLNPLLSGNQATGNATNGYVFQPLCRMQGENTWYAGDLPYVIASGGNWCDIGSSGPVTLTIQPGTVVKLANALSFHFNTVVTATGTAEAPIIFTSLKDDSVGGDTNNDGDASSPAPGDWGMIEHDGVEVRGTYEHVILRYGGGSQASYGPTVAARAGASLVLRWSEISQSYGTGLRALDTSSLTVTESEIMDHRNSGAELNSTGGVLFENNRIQRCPAGIRVFDGTPTISGNFFEGNELAVDVLLPSAVPVVSPHNRFVGGGQTAIRNVYPQDQCINAQSNWWGDASGPEDTSTAADACGLLDNPSGSGAPVSDGVNYTLWDGGTGRPLIGWPRCGVTARTQPLFTGWAAAGATVSFYDDGALIGETVADTNSTFTWVPPVPLADGLHLLSAVAITGGETSLPTPLLPLEVDSDLPFDPMGVLVSYDMHGRTYTQRMRDENGCATLAGALDMPLWVRPGTAFSVTVPMRSAFLPSLRVPTAGSLTLQASESVGAPAGAGVLDPEAIEETVTLENTSSHTVTSVRVASKVASTLYGKFDTGQPLDNMLPGDTRSIDLPQGDYLITFLSGPGNVVDAELLQVIPGSAYSVPIHQMPQNELVVSNDTGRDFTGMYLVSGGDSGFIGGDYISASTPVGSGKTVRLKFPSALCNLLVLKDADNAYYMRDINLLTANEFQFSSTDPATTVTLNYGGTYDQLCRLLVYRHKGLPTANPSISSFAIDFLELMNHSPLSNGDAVTFKLEPGSYYIEAVGCSGRTIAKWQAKEIRGLSETMNVAVPCVPPGRLRVGSEELRAYANSSTELQCGEDVGGFTTCTASAPVSASELTLDMCYEPSESEGGIGWELGVGALIIDPDGYVYDAALGFDTKVPGATVLCEVYDEDYQAWSEWPAAFYEGQINPQVTASDGYYAFFVPPGLYRVSASALGYEAHTSPDIQVISEIVHYNIPLQPTEPAFGIFLPLILR